MKTEMSREKWEKNVKGLLAEMLGAEVEVDVSILDKFYASNETPVRTVNAILEYENEEGVQEVADRLAKEDCPICKEAVECVACHLVQYHDFNVESFSQEQHIRKGYDWSKFKR